MMFGTRAGRRHEMTGFVMLAAETESAGTADLGHDLSEHVTLPCEGEDEWCVVSLRTDADRDAVAAVTGGVPLADWTATRTPQEVADRLQAAGVAAGPMCRPDDVYDHPQLRWRSVLSDMTHPLFEVPLPAETGPAPFRNIPPAPQRPAPLPGEDTRRICRDVLGMDNVESERLIADGVLFVTEDRATEDSAAAGSAPGARAPEDREGAPL